MISNCAKWLHCNIKGAMEPVKMLLEYLHLSYSGIKQELDALKPMQCSNEQWDKMKEALLVEFPISGNIDDFDIKLMLSCSLATCKYLAHKYKPKMAGSAMNEFAEIDTLLFLAHDIRNMLIDAQEENWEAKREQVMGKISEKLEFVNKFLRARIWLSGKQVSIADFIFCELLEYITSIDSLCNIQKFPNCLKLLRKFNAIPEVSKYKKTRDIIDLEANGHTEALTDQ